MGFSPSYPKTFRSFIFSILSSGSLHFFQPSLQILEFLICKFPDRLICPIHSVAWFLSGIVIFQYLFRIMWLRFNPRPVLGFLEGTFHIFKLLPIFPRDSLDIFKAFCLIARPNNIGLDKYIQSALIAFIVNPSK